jgi:hypothetical protein
MAEAQPVPLPYRESVAATTLQIFGLIGPDESRFLAERVVAAIDRAGMRGPTDGGPTGDEIRRCYDALHRRGAEVTHDDVYAGLFAALCEHGLGT